MMVNDMLESQPIMRTNELNKNEGIYEIHILH